MTGTAAPTDPEDLKILTLARSARARTDAREGACVRDRDGRTYAAASVELPHLRLSAIQVAIAMAVSSGAAGVEAVALVGSTDTAVGEDDRAVVRDLAGGPVPVWVADPAGSVIAVANA